MMDEIDLVDIENRALATANPRIIRPIRLGLMGKLAAEDVPKLTEEIHQCWKRIAELEAQVKGLRDVIQDNHVGYRMKTAELEAQVEAMESAGMAWPIERERLRIMDACLDGKPIASPEQGKEESS